MKKIILFKRDVRASKKARGELNIEFYSFGDDLEWLIG